MMFLVMTGYLVIIGYWCQPYVPDVAINVLIHQDSRINYCNSNYPF